MIHHYMSAFLFLVALGACTANVENPTVNQQGHGGNTACVTTCDDTNTTCTAKCNDEGCKATCKTDLDKCTVDCDKTDAGK